MTMLSRPRAPMSGFGPAPTVVRPGRRAYRGAVGAMRAVGTALSITITADYRYS
jgi:hypothetical protein